MVFPNNKVFEPLFGKGTKQEAHQEDKPGQSQATSDDKSKPIQEEKKSPLPPPAHTHTQPQPQPQTPQPQVVRRPHFRPASPSNLQNKLTLAGLGSTSQGRIVLLLAIVLVVLAIIVYFYYNTSKKNSKSLKRLNRDVEMIKRIQRKRSMLRRRKHNARKT